MSRLVVVSFALLAVPVGVRGEDEGPDPVGRPEAFRQGRVASYALWYDEGVWHLRATSRLKVFHHGRIAADGDKVGIRPVGIDPGKKAADSDWIVPHRGRRGFDFQLITIGRVDGIDFKVGPKAKTVTFKLHVGGDDDPQKILIGKAGVNPEKATFTLAAHPQEEPEPASEK